MKYQMLGENTSTPEEMLEKYTGEVDWSYVKPHLDAGVVLYVDPSLTLTEVGKAFYEDSKDKVNTWLKSGDIIKPSEPHTKYWESTNARFLAAVVSPFVLIQPVKS